jgi:hypothetical protein
MIDEFLRSMGWAIVPLGVPGEASRLCLVRPFPPIGARPFASRHLLGCGVLLLTIIPGYMASRLTGAHETPRVISARAGFQGQLDSLIEDVATRYGVPPDLIAAIIEAESEFNPRAVSRHGALGLMQLMPETAARLGVDDPFDPRENIEAGVRHLRSLIDQFDYNLPLVLAAYNAGEVAVIRHGGIPPYRETRRYVNRILRRLDRDEARTSDLGEPERKI